VIARFERMPPHLKLVIGGIGALSKEDILNHLRKKDEIGKLLVKMQIEYLKLLAEEAKRYEENINNFTRS
jgi:hypothetical protein